MDINLAKVEDIIEWTFPTDECTPKYFRGNTFQGSVEYVNHDNREYGVYCEYGMDYVGFDDCKIIKRK